MKTLLFTCTILILFSASAQEADTIQLQEILIAARIAPSDSLPYPALQPPIQTMDLLDRIPGVVRAQQASFPISYRGQTGSRMRIQQNGARRSGLNPQGYLGQDLNVSNLSTARIVDGIEKATYGSGAIGGVLELEDRQAFEASPNVIQSQFGTNNNARQLGFRWGIGNQPITFDLTGNGVRTDDMFFAKNERSRNSAIQEYQLASALTTQLKKAQLSWRQKWSSGIWEFPQGFQNFPFELRKLDNAYTYQTDIKFQQALNNGWQLSQQVWGLTVKTDQIQDVYNAQFDSINIKVVRNFRRNSAGYNGFVEKSFGKYHMKSGFDLFTSRLVEDRTDDNRIDNSFTSSRVAQRDDQQVGAFIKASSRSQNVQWTGVLRADVASTNNLHANRAYASVITGGIEAKIALWKIDHQVSLGRYFRFPRPEESGGELFGGRGTFRGNPDIRPESSYQLEWNASKNTASTSFKISSWLAYYEDRIIDFPVADERNVFEYRNIDQARTFGLEWYFSRVLLDQKKHNLVGLLSGLVMQGDDLTNTHFFGKGSRSNGIPPAHVQAEFKYKTWLGSVPIQLGIDARHYARFIAPTGFTNQVWAVRDAPAYMLLGLNANTRFQWNQHGLTITVRLSNLTDQSYFPFGTRIPGIGRDFRFGVNYSF